jgi:hypothetical protein
MTAPLQLLDVHAGTSPSWWPPAAGWWWLAAGVCLVLGVCGWRMWRRRWRRVRVLRLFDDTLAAAASPQAQVAAMSELLRRAARRAKPGVEVLDGEAWLAALDAGLPTPVFRAGAGRLLLDGAYRRDLAPGQIDALRAIARTRFASWMAAA